MCDLRDIFVSSVPSGVVYLTSNGMFLMLVTIIKKNKTVNIRSGREAVFSVGISRLRLRKRLISGLLSLTNTAM